MELYLFLSFPFALGGAVITGIAAAMRRSAVNRRRRATARADARIVEKRIIRIGSPGTRSHSHYVYEFSVDGIPRRAEYAGKSSFKVGDIVSIFYDPDHPGSIYIPKVSSGLATVVLYFIGLVWLGGGVMLFLYWMLGIK